MTPSELMKAMADAGAPFDAILIAMRALEAKDAVIAERDAAAAEKRAKDAERKRNERNGVGVQGQSKDSPKRVQAPPIDNISLPPELYPSEAKASLAPRGKKPKSIRLPDDWEPEPLTGEALEMVSVWQPGRLERELAKYRDYWKQASGRRAAKPDWQAAWRNWLRNADDWNQGKQNGNDAKQHNGDMGSTERAARQALHDLSGGTGRFEGSGSQIPPADATGSNRIIDAVPDAMRSIGYAGGR